VPTDTFVRIEEATTMASELFLFMRTHVQLNRDLIEGSRRELADSRRAMVCADVVLKETELLCQLYAYRP
jgi:hypothetical protein